MDSWAQCIYTLKLQKESDDNVIGFDRICIHKTKIQFGLEWDRIIDYNVTLKKLL